MNSPLNNVILCSFCLLNTAMGLPAAQAQPNLDPAPQISKSDDAGMISIASRFSTKLTSERLIAGLQKKNWQIYAKIDHQAQAQQAGLALRPTLLLLVGQPLSNTLLLHQNQTLALDLPLKYLVWEASDHQVYISWNNTYYLAQRHGLPQNFDLLSQLSQQLFQLAKAAGN